jgi:hypothetical protein
LIKQSGGLAYNKRKQNENENGNENEYGSDGSLVGQLCGRRGDLPSYFFVEKERRG